MAGHDPRWTAFVRGFPAAKAELETAVLEAMERGASEWPALELSAEPFAEALGRAIAAATDPAAALGAVEAGDLFLATACLAGIPGATLALEQSYGAEIDAALRARDKHDSAAADLRQSARERLLVGTGGRRPKLAEYSGGGALLHWLPVGLVRMPIDARRHQQGGGRPCFVCGQPRGSSPTRSRSIPNSGTQVAFSEFCRPRFSYPSGT